MSASVAGPSRVPSPARRSSVMQPPRASPPPPPPRADVFRPSLPLDPFRALEQNRPWVVNLNVLETLQESPSRRQVVLLVGEPTSADLKPLLHASSLASSLLLVVTNAPLPLPSSPTPSVYVLRTTRPLSPSALEIVSILERAERVARRWQQDMSASGGVTKHFFEPSLGGNFVPDEPSSSLPPGPIQSSLRHSHSAASLASKRSRKAKKGEHKGSSSSSSSATLPRSRGKASTSARVRINDVFSPSSARPFDAIVHFVRLDTPEKDALKRVILMTTMSQTFLVSVNPSSASLPVSSAPRLSVFAQTDSAHSSSDSLPRLSQQNSRWSRLLGDNRSRTSLFSPSAFQEDLPSVHEEPEEPLRKAKVIHVLPPSLALETPPPLARPSRLARKLEEFLYTFGSSYAQSATLSPPSSRSSSVLSTHPEHLSSGPELASSTSSVASHRPESLASLRSTIVPSKSHSPRLFLLPAGVLGAPSPSPAEEQPRAWTASIGELLLLGVFDHSEDDLGGLACQRVWLGSAHDVQCTTSSTSQDLQRPPTAHVRSRSASSSVVHGDVSPARHAPALPRTETQSSNSSISTGSEQVRRQSSPDTVASSVEDNEQRATVTGGVHKGKHDHEKPSGKESKRWMFWKR